MSKSVKATVKAAVDEVTTLLAKSEVEKTKAKKAKLSARNGAPMPKLGKLAKLIKSKAMTEADLVGAIGEVCMVNKVSPTLTSALVAALSTSLDQFLADDAIDG